MVTVESCVIDPAISYDGSTLWEGLRMRIRDLAASLLVVSLVSCVADDFVAVESAGHPRRTIDDPPEKTSPTETSGTGPDQSAKSAYDAPAKPKPESAASKPASKDATDSPPARTPPSLPPELEARISTAKDEAPRGERSIEAIVAGGAALRAHPEYAPWLGDRLEVICRDVFFGPDIVPGMERVGVRRHAVRAGESPWKIARAMRVESGLLDLLNPKLDATHLRVGQRLKVVDLAAGDIEVDIDRTAHRLALYRVPADGGEPQLMLYVPCATGTPKTPTPSGTTKVGSIVFKPPYVDRKSGKTLSNDDPSHPWGAVRIVLDGEPLDVERIQIHGRPGRDIGEFAGKAVSDGDLWLRTDDLERLAYCLREGTKITIH